MSTIQEGIDAEHSVFIMPGGDVYIGGQFVRQCFDLGQTDYMAKWDGNAWGTPDWTPGLGWHPYSTCRFCGFPELPYTEDTCPCCGGPTKQWWYHLDQMLDDWKCGLAG